MFGSQGKLILHRAELLDFMSADNAHRVHLMKESVSAGLRVPDTDSYRPKQNQDHSFYLPC